MMAWVYSLIIQIKKMVLEKRKTHCFTKNIKLNIQIIGSPNQAMVLFVSHILRIFIENFLLFMSPLIGWLDWDSSVQMQ